MVKYAIEYKSASYPYSYRFLKTNAGEFKGFDSITDARRKSIVLIQNYDAILCAIRGNGKEGLVYATRSGGYVYEDRNGNKSKWYRLNKNGVLGSRITNIKSIDIITSYY